MSQTNSPQLDAQARIAQLEAQLVSVQAAHDAIKRERDVLRASYERLRLELELLKRRIYVAKAERVDTKQLELEFAQKLRALNEVAGTLNLPADSEQADGGEQPKGKKGKKPSGRRDLSQAAIEEERIEIKDPLFESLLTQGKAEAIGFEESYKLCYKRGGMRKLVVARAKYRAIGSDGEAEIETAPMPSEMLPRSLSTPSLLSRVAIDKHCDGLPLFRIEDRFAREGFGLDRSIMSRWLEDAGATVGATVVASMREEALKTAFCIATDATGVMVQPERNPGAPRQACRRGHYFVLIADRDHILFEYTPKETSAVVAEMFAGFTGYIQADAKSVYDVLFAKPDKHKPNIDDDEGPHEIGCMSHCRRRFWEAAVQKSAVGREGLVRIRRIYEVDESFAGKPVDEVKRLRDAHLRPHLESFFAWAAEEYERVKDQRGTLRSALGYAVRQRHALCAVLDDGRLILDNNRSERQIKTVALGRKAWLFVGSDDHGTAAGHLMSLIASARLHGIGPEVYLRNLFRVLPHWPRERYIELAPKYWAATAERLDSNELAAEIGPLTIPDALTPAE